MAYVALVVLLEQRIQRRDIRCLRNVAASPQKQTKYITRPGRRIGVQWQEEPPQDLCALLAVDLPKVVLGQKLHRASKLLDCALKRRTQRGSSFLVATASFP